MTYNYFNTSMLAFGLNLTNAFKSLGRKLDTLNTSLEVVKNSINENAKYDKTNYPAATPTRVDAAVRSKELYDLLDKVTIVIKNFSLEDDILTVEANLFEPQRNRLTCISGSTEVTQPGKYWILYKPSLDNNKPEKTIFFLPCTLNKSKYNNRGYQTLCKVIVENDRITLTNLNEFMSSKIYPSNYYNHYVDIVYVDTFTKKASKGYNCVSGTTYDYRQIDFDEVVNSIEFVKDSEDNKLYRFNPTSITGNNIYEYARKFFGYTHPTEELFIGDEAREGSWLINTYLDYISERRGKDE